ncbi:DUF2997 domain-containing protein [Gloeobacter kilaueensis]|uniref:DUF2997 domain-containing protein n=1 Tax=Gloeobacter kilaueensis (strain ATCC BAA-2537 / CCAP 1431/1 / ULC 316 / JS1) TaxID=1183438 RepID=U5QBV8_GLOK1|nr:DUF2997 domain-containing protein [Gloeobacter kilaueensis]AGY56321.1 hypothetical protein GKIL_0074 [Gloeobacter kilaueensis JS1]
MEQIEFIIHPDGRVEERVEGVTGNSCSELTRSIEQALGHTCHTQLTAEYYQQAQVSQSLWNTFEPH